MLYIVHVHNATCGDWGNLASHLYLRHTPIECLERVQYKAEACFEHVLYSRMLVCVNAHNREFSRAWLMG